MFDSKRGEGIHIPEPKEEKLSTRTNWQLDSGSISPESKRGEPIANDLPQTRSVRPFIAPQLHFSLCVYRVVFNRVGK